MSQPKPTQAELAILDVLWAQGPSTVREVHTVLNEKQETAYTTILKFMQIMHGKGLVTRDSSAKAHVYTAAVSESDTQAHFVKELLDGPFKGSARNLVLRALSVKPSSPEELAEIKRLIEQLEKNNE